MPSSEMRILLAEDNPIAQHVVVKYLKHNGYAVDMAKDGQIAWQMLLQQSYDLLLTDIQMPELGGLELIKKIRTQAKLNITIIVLSAYTTAELRQQCLQAGADGFFTKPLRLDKLKQILSHTSTY